MPYQFPEVSAFDNRADFQDYTDPQLRDIAREISSLRRYGFQFERAFGDVCKDYSLEGDQLTRIENHAKRFWDYS
jgi:hypothetical protein